MSDDFEIPRCEHGAIILGCDQSPCAAQDHYIADQNKLVDEYHAKQHQAAVEYVRSLLGLES